MKSEEDYCTSTISALPGDQEAGTPTLLNSHFKRVWSCHPIILSGVVCIMERGGHLVPTLRERRRLITIPPSSSSLLRMDLRCRLADKFKFTSRESWLKNDEWMLYFNAGWASMGMNCWAIQNLQHRSIVAVLAIPSWQISSTNGSTPYRRKRVGVVIMMTNILTTL